MKITLSHTEKVDVVPDAAAIGIRIECSSVDHAASTSRVNLRQNEILENLEPLGIREENLRLLSHATSFDEYSKEPEKAQATRELELKLKFQSADLIRQILDRLAFDHEEVTATLAWKISDSSNFRHELLKSAIASIQRLAEAASPSGTAKVIDLKVDDSSAQVQVRRNPTNDFTGIECCIKAPRLIEHESAAIEPGAIRYSLKITGTFDLA